MVLVLNQDGKDGRIDQDLDFESGWKGWHKIMEGTRMEWIKGLGNIQLIR